MDAQGGLLHGPGLHGAIPDRLLLCTGGDVHVALVFGQKKAQRIWIKSVDLKHHFIENNYIITVDQNIHFIEEK